MLIRCSGPWRGNAYKYETLGIVASSLSANIKTPKRAERLIYPLKSQCFNMMLGTGISILIFYHLSMLQNQIPMCFYENINQYFALLKS